MRFALMATLLMALCSIELATSYRATLTNVKADASGLALAVESSVLSHLATTKFVLDRISRRLVEADLVSGGTTGQAERLNAWLADLAGSIPISTGVDVFDASGSRLFASVPDQSPASIADRDYFRKLLAEPGKETEYSEIVIDLPTQRPVMFAVRALRNPQGRLLGAARVRLDLGAIADLLEKLYVGSKGSIALRRLDNGAQLLRIPGKIAVDNRPSLNLETRDAIVAGSLSGTLSPTVSPIDGITRLYAYRKFGDFPFFVTVGVAQSDYLADWRAKLLAYLAALATLIGLLLMLERARRLEAEYSAREEKRLRAILDASPVPQALSNAEGRVVYLNPAFVATLGYSLDDVPTLSAWRPLAFPDNDYRSEVMTAWRERLLAHQESGNAFQPLEVRVRKPDGSDIAMLCSAARVTDQSDSMLLVSLIDISTLKEQERLLQIQHRRLNDIVVGTHAGTWEWNIPTGDTIFNERWADMLGYSPEELQPATIETWTRLTHPEDLARSTELLEKHFAGEISYYQCEVRMKHQDGHWTWILDRGKVSSWSDDGQPLLMSGTHQDITDRKKGQIALEASERRFRALVEASAQIVWQCDPLGKVAEELPSWQRYTGQTPEQSLDFGYVEAIHPDDRQAVSDLWREALTQGQSGISFTYRLRHASGEWRWNAARAVPIRDDKGKIASWVGMCTDIHEHHMAQVELEQHRQNLERLVAARTADLEVAREAAESANRAKTAFLSTVSHELRTPMNGVMGMLALARQRTTDVQVRNYLDKADRASHQLLGIINDVLDISQIEANRLTLALTPFSVTDVIAPVIETLETLATNKGLEISVDIPRDLAGRQYLGDPTRLSQVMLNLVSNAIKFTGKGHIRIQAREQANGSDTSMLQFEVADSGLGIRAEDQDRIFEPFTQVDSSSTRKFGGTGLGLALCKRLVLAMHGTITVDSRPGEGSTFRITIPVQQPPSVLPTPEDDPFADAQRLQTHHHGAAILVVEDDPVSLEIVRAMLESAGMSVYTAENGSQAVEYAKSGGFQLILMDMKMPQMNGIDATREIREIPSHVRTPIIAITANAFFEDRDECLRAGMNDHLAKPVTPGALYQMVLRWLEHQ